MKNLDDALSVKTKTGQHFSHLTVINCFKANELQCFNCLFVS